MLFCPVFAKLHSRRSLVLLHTDHCSRTTSHYSPKSHGINPFADPHPLNPVASIFYKNIGGRGYLRLSPLGAPENPSRIYFSFQLLARCPSRNSFLLITFHFHGGMGFILSSLSTTRCSLPALSAVFSYSCALFCTLQKLNPFIFKLFHTLCQKHPGVGWASC